MQTKHSLLLLAAAIGVRAQVDLGSAQAFAVLANTTITNTGTSNIQGAVGIYPGTSITGFPPGTVNGKTYTADAVAEAAQADAQKAYNAAAAQQRTADMSDKDLGTWYLEGGVYFYYNGAALTGDLVLDGNNDSSSVFIFQITDTLTTGTGSSVTLINGALACNVFWQVGSSATLGIGTVFVGNIVAQEYITLESGVSVNGGIYSLGGAITMDRSDVSVMSECVAAIPSSSILSTPSSTATSSSSTASSSSVSTASTPSLSPPPAGATLSSGLTSSVPPSTSPTSSPASSSMSPSSRLASSVSSLLNASAPLSTASATTSQSLETSSLATASIAALLSANGSPSAAASPWGNVTAPSSSTKSGSGLHSPNGIASATTTVTQTTAVTFTVTCSTAPTTIETYSQTFVVETPCTTVLTATVESVTVFCVSAPTATSTATAATATAATATATMKTTTTTPVGPPGSTPTKATSATATPTTTGPLVVVTAGAAPRWTGAGVSAAAAVVFFSVLLTVF